MSKDNLYLNLLEKIENKTAKITVIGLGYVGLPTALILANAGYHVFGLDINEKIVITIKNKESPTNEPGLKELIEKLLKNGKFKVTTEYEKALSNVDIVIYIVNTPLGENKLANLTFLEKAVSDSAKYIRKGMLLVIGSTVPPKTTESIVKKIIETKTGLRAGMDFWLAYCPERIAPGKAIKELTENNRLAGGIDEKSTELAYRLLSKITKGKVIKTTALVAEISKLAENTFRDVNIAFANELALICEQLGADVIEVIKCANTHPRVNIHKPGNGVGGPCLTKDPYFLINSIDKNKLPTDLINASRKINDYMPRHTVELLEKALLKYGKNIRDSTIAIFGLAYKGNVDDIRESPALKIIKLVKKRGATVKLMDPYVKKWERNDISQDPISTAKNTDAIIIATDHNIFLNLNFDKIRRAMNIPIIIDSKRILSEKELKSLGFEYIGIGKGNFD
ncbi:MAG: nucleotide sugar dehydrogenase [Candidatus Asgardarchaeia archaeon]